MIAFFSLFEHDLLGFHFHSTISRISGLSVGRFFRPTIWKENGCRRHSSGPDPYFVMDLLSSLFTPLSFFLILSPTIYTWRAAQDERVEGGGRDDGAFGNNSSNAKALYIVPWCAAHLSLFIRRLYIGFLPILLFLSPFRRLSLSHSSLHRKKMTKMKRESIIKRAPCLLSHALVCIQQWIEERPR